MSMIERGVYAFGLTAVLTGIGAWGLNQIGLANKVMRTSAPNFVDACMYGAVRGVMTFGIAAFSAYLHQSVKDEWARKAIAVGALVALYFSVPYASQLTKQHLNVKIPEQFTYLVLLVEFYSFS